MALDARLRYTKMVIKNSFAELLKKKPINKITVKEICEMAEINRATFYKHYLDVYDLLDKIEEEFLGELRESIGVDENKSTKETLIMIMTNIKAKADTYKALFSDNGDPTFPRRVFEEGYRIERIKEDIKGNKNLSDENIKCLYNYIAYGCNGILSQWIAGNMEGSVSETADFADMLVKNTIAAVYGK